MHIVPTPLAAMTYQTVVELAAPIIERHHNDLYHIDCLMIYQHPGRPFVHSATEYGTHLLFLPAPVDDDSPIPYLFGHLSPSRIWADEALVVARSLSPDYTGRVHRYLVFDGRAVRAVAHAGFAEAYRQAADWALRIMRQRGIPLGGSASKHQRTPGGVHHEQRHA